MLRPVLYPSCGRISMSSETPRQVDVAFTLEFKRNIRLLDRR